MFKNKKILAIFGIILILAVGAGGYFFVAGRSQTAVEEEQAADEGVIQAISPKDLGLTLEASPDNKKVKFLIAKMADITSIEYELTYEADSTPQDMAEGGEARVQRGVTGESKIKPGEDTFESSWLDLGSCSKNVCKYDSGVESVTLTLKITKNDGKLYQTEETLSF